MERTYSYRNGCLFFVAFWFGGLGLLFSGMALKAMLSGQPMPTRLSDGTIITMGAAAWLPVFLPALAVPIGVWLLLFAMNSKVALDDKGVRIYNWSKKQIFSAAWVEIVSVYRSPDLGNSYSLAIQTANRTEMVTRSVIGIDDLERALHEKLGTEILPTGGPAATTISN
jgi:hypothetical protein